MSRILIAEDEPRIASFVEKGLRANGFSTAIASDAQEVLNMVLGGDFDLLLLDLGLPIKDGLTVLEELRGQGAKLPIIILTARHEVQTKVAGFEGGADDYVTKPFSFEELLVRIRVRLRSPQQNNLNMESKMILQLGNIILNLRTRKATIKDKEIYLPTKEFTLLETFLRHPDQVMSREQLLDHVWGYDYDPGSNIVDVYVGYLRKKLDGDRIETVRGMGYRLRK